MNKSPVMGMPSDQTYGDAPKDRPCLRCKDTFASEWSGERICPQCKRSVAWREGAPLQAFPGKKR